MMQVDQCIPPVWYEQTAQLINTNNLSYFTNPASWLPHWNKRTLVLSCLATFNPIKYQHALLPLRVSCALQGQQIELTASRQTGSALHLVSCSPIAKTVKTVGDISLVRRIMVTCNGGGVHPIFPRGKGNWRLTNAVKHRKTWWWASY